MAWEDDSLEAYKQLVRLHGIAASGRSQPERSEPLRVHLVMRRTYCRVPAGVWPDGVGLTLVHLHMEDRGVCHCTTAPTVYRPCQDEPPL